MVTTLIGAESISDDNEVLIEAEDSNDFAKKTVVLYNDDKLWTRLSNNGKELAEKHYSPEFVQSTICQILEYCLKNKIINLLFSSLQIYCKSNRNLSSNRFNLVNNLEDSMIEPMNYPNELNYFDFNSLLQHKEKSFRLI